MGLSPASHMLPAVLKISISVASCCVHLQSSVFVVVGCSSGPERPQRKVLTVCTVTRTPTLWHTAVQHHNAVLPAKNVSSTLRLFVLTTRLRVLTALVLWHSAYRPVLCLSRPFSSCSDKFCSALPSPGICWVELDKGTPTSFQIPTCSLFIIMYTVQLIRNENALDW